MSDKNFDEMSRAEKIAAIVKALPGGQSSGPLLPLPAAADRSKLSAVDQEKLFENWISDIETRRPGTWNADEKAAYRVAVERALRAL
jgi:hypothetical protein